MVTFLLIFLCQPIQIDIRVMMDKAYKSESAATEMLHFLEQIEKPTATEKAYLGTIYMLMADRANLPWNKMKHFHTGKELIDKASKMNPNDLEVRYLRFASQTHAPAFLGYDDFLEADKAVLIAGLQNLKDSDLRKRIKAVLLLSKHITDQEKELIK